ncbi:MAG TPA: RidA family protein [Terriglobales bacterium]|nr:RidA family protein [Terriglobales bacterium]
MAPAKHRDLVVSSQLLQIIAPAFEHAGDLCAQTRRTFNNITALLTAEDATWKDIVRTTCYLRDIERDYAAAFNAERTAFYGEQGLNPLPASTGIRLCSAALTCCLKSKPLPCSGASGPQNRGQELNWKKLWGAQKRPASGL